MPPLILLKASGYTTGPWLDQSPNGNNATLENGTATLNADGNGLVLNGSTSWTFPNIAAGNAWTLNTWFKLTSPVLNYPQIIGQLSSTSNNMVINASTAGFSGNFFNDGVWSSTNLFNLTVGSWTNIQLTWDGTNMNLYLNGVLIETTTPGGVSTDNNSDYYIGRDVGNNYITGEIGEVRIYNTPLTQTQVTADYQESLDTFVPPPTPASILLSGDQTVYVGTNVNLTATVTDQYSQPFTIDTLYITGNDGSTYTSTNNGTYTFTVTNPNVGTVLYTANHNSITSNTISVNYIAVPEAASIVLSGTQSVSSESMSTTITATVTDQYSNPFYNDTITLTGDDNSSYSATNNYDGTYSFTVSNQNTLTVVYTATNNSVTSNTVSVNYIAIPVATSIVVSGIQSVSSESMSTMITATVFDQNSNPFVIDVLTLTGDDNSLYYGTNNYNGTHFFTVSNQTTVTVVYTATYNSLTSNTLSVIYTALPVATSIVLSGSQIVYSATNVTLTATVFDQYSQPFTIDTLYITGNDGTTYSSINDNGIFTFTVSNPNVVTVVYTATDYTLTSNTVSVQYIAVPPPSPYSLLLKASDYTSGPWLDQSTYGNNATLSSGTATKNTAGNGLVLDGQTSWTFPNVPTSNSWTASVWYKQDGPLSGNPCILTQGSTDNLITLFIGVSPTSNSISGGFLNNNWNTGGPITLPNAWINIQVTWDGTDMKTYIYGELSSSVNINYSSNEQGLPYHIGKNWNGTDFITGEIGEVRMYNYPLTQSEVTADFQESLSTFINPLVPYGLSASLTATSITASWLGATAATSYTYTLNGSSVIPHSVASNSATFTGLNSATQYTLVVTAINSSGSESATRTFTTLDVPPTAPIVTIGTITAYSFTASWTGTGATSYTYMLNSSPVSPSAENIISKTATFTGLDGDTLYSFVITAVNSVGSDSTEISLTTLPPPPSPFTDVIFSEFTPYSFMASWLGAEGAISYSYTLNGTAALPLEDTINKTAVFSGLTPNTNYSLVITATNIHGSTSTPTDSPYYTQTPDPLMPYALSASNITQTSFTISWQGGIGATSYNYSFDKNPDTPTVIDNGVASKSATFTGLSPGSAYNVSITAVNSTPGADPETMADLIQVYTNSISIEPPSTPIVSTSMITQTSFKASWTDGDIAVSYIYTLNGTEVTPIIDVSAEKYAIFTALSASTTYSLVVTAVNYNGSTVAEAVSITTLAPPLANLLLLKAIDYRRGVWQDQSSSANNATLEFGTATKNTAGNGLVLNGSTSWTFPNLELGNSWTAAVWYKQTQAVNGACILSQKGTNTNIAIVDDSVGLTAGFFNGAWYTGQSATLNGWTNVQATWDGTNLKTYVNGTLTDSSQPGGTSPNTTLAYSIGSRDGVTFAKGEIGEVRIYNYPLTQSQVTADYTASVNTFATPVPGTPPTALANLATNTVTGGSFGLTWTGGFGATSYTYTLNGTPATPSMDKALTGQTVTFTGLTASTPYTVVVKAINANGEPSATISVTTLSPPPPPTVAAVAAVQQTFTVVSTPAAAATAIQAALAANVAPQALVAAALAVATPAMFTALVSSPAFVGSTVSVPPAAAAALYAAFSPTVTVDTTLPLEVNFPAADGSVRPPASGSNSKLAIDLTRDTFVPFNGATGYGIDVRGGIQYFVTPTNTTGTLVNVGDPITFTLDVGATITFTVADLDIVFTPYTAPVVIICFLGSAPVLTPTGYTRIDKLAVGDIVNTPTGTATIEAIKTQLCEPSADSNPYVIPEGIFGANRKLLISPRHKVSVSGHMFEARQLGLQQEVQAKPFVYYNLQITKSQNMIVAGVEVESLKQLVRVTISRQAFDFMLIKHGGMTPEIRSRCHFLADGSVSVPSTI